MKTMKTCVVMCAVMMSAACGAGNVADEPTTSARQAQVNQYTSPGDGFSTSSSWFETEDGVVILDAQFLPEYAEALLDQIAARTDKPVTDVIVLHGNPDKYNGIAAIRARFPQVHVLSTPAIVARIKEIDAGKRGYFGPQYGDRYPAELVLPDALISAREVRELGGVSVELIPMGAGVSSAHLVVRLPATGDVFVGDLLHHEVHGWLAEGFSDQWLTRLDEIAALTPTRIHGGRGASTGPDGLAEQARYLKAFQTCVTPHLAEAAEAAAPAIKACVIEAAPGYAMDMMIDFSSPGELARQQQR
jgi:glyoxylase-like metal-dependent hydrolase (beta-lactamase superfamily II)